MPVMRWQAIASVLLLGACPSARLQLLVDVRTDFVPGSEFTAIRTSVFEAFPDPGAEPNRELAYPALASDDFATGKRVATVDVPNARVYVRAQLFAFDGRLVAERVVAVEALTSQITIAIARRCAGVRCGPDERCVMGSCVPCEGGSCAPECVRSADCPAAAASCAAPTCVEGACFLFPVPGACATDEYCDPDDGCVGRPIVPDAGVDGGSSCSCAGRECGDDGCGGSCGTCPSPMSCFDGDCRCDCAGRTCGDDGCGGSCGECGADQVCSGGACVCECGGRTCGVNACGRDCGTCPGGTVCRGGTCACDALGAPCVVGAGECCDGNACDATRATCCRPVQSTCGSVAECCSGRACVGGFCCVVLRDSCSMDAQCCNFPAHTCTGGRCCVTNGSGCSMDDQCCSGNCTMGTCRA
jgi:hypothetical protein